MIVEVEWYRNSQRLGGDPKNAGDGDFKIVANKNTRQLVLNQFKSERSHVLKLNMVFSIDHNLVIFDFFPLKMNQIERTQLRLVKTC